MIKKLPRGELDRLAYEKIAIDPLTQADDHFDYSKAVVKKPWGYEYLMYQNEHVAVWILYIKEGFQTSLHCHPNKKTSLVMLSGTAICSSLGERISRSVGEGLMIEEGVFHCTESRSENGIFVMEIESPNNKRDLVRLEDKYGRVHKGYESVSDMSFNIQNYNYLTFIEPSIFYNVKKKFGACGLSLACFKDAEDFKANFELKGWDAVSILKGQILNDRDEVILNIGDTIDLATVESLPDIRINDAIEVIIIKKRDSMIKLSDYVADFLEKANVKDLFILPGSPNVHLLDSIGRNTGLRHFCSQTEQAAALAAEAYAKLTKRPAVAVIASGASGTNAMTGVADAWVDSTPLVVLSGQSRSDETTDGGVRQLGIQELDIVSIVKPITKYAVKIDDPNSIRYHLEKAFYLARENRPGPVWIDIPIDIQGMNIDEEELKSFDPSELKKLNEPDQDFGAPGGIHEQVTETLRLIRQSERPVLLVGNGIRLADAEEDLLRLIDLLAIPVLTSRRGADLLPEDHPHYYGRPGAYGQRSANFIIQNSDLLLSIGSRLSLPQIGRNYKAFARAATRIMVDIDKAELEKSTITPHLAVHCSAGIFIREMIAEISRSNIEFEPRTPWIERCRIWKSKYAESPDEVSGPAGQVNAYFFMKTLAQLLNAGAIVSIDGGSPLVFFMQAFSFKDGQRLISATGLENTGFALPAAIGSCIGGAGREIICICEDRGFQKSIQELQTVIRYNLPIKIFILNTGGYSWIRETQREYFGGRYVASEPETERIAPDMKRIGEAYNLKTWTISSHRELAASFSDILGWKGPVLCEVKIDKSQKIVPKIAFTVKPDGKWLSKPLEDMHPFLDRTEFADNMLIGIVEEE